MCDFAHVLFRFCPCDRATSERSIYLRDQAAECLRHTTRMIDAGTIEALRRLAAEYLAGCTKIESEEGLEFPRPYGRSRLR